MYVKQVKIESSKGDGYLILVIIKAKNMDFGISQILI